MGNSVIFPAPADKELPSWIEPRLKYFTKPKVAADERRSIIPFFCCGERKIAQKIPYLHFKEERDPEKTQYLLIYFHGNSEVLSQSYKTMEKYHEIFQVNIFFSQFS